MRNAGETRKKREAELIDQAAEKLLRAVKQEMLRKEGRVDYAALREAGYGKRLLARLREV